MKQKIVFFFFLILINTIFSEEAKQKISQVDSKDKISIGYADIKLGMNAVYIKRRVELWDALHRNIYKGFSASKPEPESSYFYFAQHYYKNHFCHFYFSMDRKSLYRLDVFVYASPNDVKGIADVLSKRYGIEPVKDNDNYIFNFPKDQNNHKYQISINFNRETEFGKQYVIKYVDLAEIDRLKIILEEKRSAIYGMF